MNAKPARTASGRVPLSTSEDAELAAPLFATLERIGEGIVFITEPGQVLLANAAARRLLGFTDDGKEHEPLWERVRYASLQELVRQALVTAQPQMRELTLVAPEERIVHVEVIPARSRRGESILAIVLRDVTELRRLERVRQDFVANVSHELRTPLTSVKGFIETLLEGAIDDPTNNRRFLTLMEEDVNRLARLTDDLLELSKVESLGRPKTSQPVDVPRIIQDVVDALDQQSHAKRITVTFQEPHSVREVRGDPDQIRQVFWNLLDNAIKYNVEGGRVDVELSIDGTHLVVSVSDTGIGIPTEELPRIFERFYRVDKARSRALGGTGLGLSIVKHIVEAHGGQVDVTSEPGRGSVFRVTLPFVTREDALGLT